MQEIPPSSRSRPAPAPAAAPPDPVVATVWPWRQADEAEGRAAEREAAQRRAARRGAAIRTAIGFLIAVALAFWKPWLAVVVVTLSLITLALALASPLGAYARLERGLDRFAYLVGLSVTWILMPILYYLLFLPTGLALRAGQKLRLTRRPEPDLPTYWVRPHGADPDDPEGRWQGAGLDRYRRQF